MNCKKYRNKALYQKKEWLSNLPKEILYFHVIGDETLDDEFKFDEEKRILWLRVEDDYCSLPKKVINAYDAISKTYEFEYIFKTDDDQILLNPHFFNIIINILNKKTPMAHYGGFIVDVQQPYLSQYHRIHNELPKNIPIKVTKYCNGRFYCLSKDAVNDLTKKKELIWKNGFIKKQECPLLKRDLLHQDILCDNIGYTVKDTLFSVILTNILWN